MAADTPTTTHKELYLIDGSGFIFRAYHALPPLTRPDGTPVGAVMGFCNMLVKLLDSHGDDHIAVIFDAARKNFRNDIYPDYKAHRPPAPEDLIPQFPLIREAAEAFGLPIAEIEGFEADDLIATYARMAVEQGKNVVIVSSDKDLMQLVRPGVRLMDPMKQTMVDEVGVFEKFGVTPDKVVDVQALAGDSVDNVPGVPGIGIKTAAELITTYGSLENLLQQTASIKQPKRRENLEQNAEMARISKKLVTLCDTATTPIPLEQLVPRTDAREKLQQFLQQQGFKSLLGRLFGPQVHTQTSTQQNPPTQIEQPHTPHPNLPPTQGYMGGKETPVVVQQYTLITTPQQLKEWLKDAAETGLLAVDTETTGLTPAREKLVGISLATRAGRACYIPLGHNSGTDLLGIALSEEPQQPAVKDIMDVLRPVFADPAIVKIGHNFKFDMQMFFPYIRDISPVEDTMLLSYVLDGTAHGNGLDELAQLMCGHSMISYDSVTGTGKGRMSFAQVKLDKACDYAAEDADFTLRLYHILKPRLAHEKMAKIYEDIERPLIPAIARMEQNGICVDPHVLRKLSQTFGEKIAALENEIQAEVGHPFNIASPKQIGAVLFEEMGLQGGSKTKTGDWSTSADILEDLAAQGHAIVQKILDFRHLSKLRSTYTEALQEAINPATGRVHTSFGMALVNTGRLSSSDPNLQNIPIRTEEGRLIRTAFVAAPDHVLISADYSQIELRLAAEMAGIKALQQSFLKGEDIHARTAAEVMGIPLESVTPDIRRQAKAINFGIIYGISGFGLAKQLGCSVGEASAYIRNYLARFPRT
jgi:DNA polymerase I